MASGSTAAMLSRVRSERKRIELLLMLWPEEFREQRLEPKKDAGGYKGRLGRYTEGFAGVVPPVILFRTPALARTRDSRNP